MVVKAAKRHGYAHDGHGDEVARASCRVAREWRDGGSVPREVRLRGHDAALRGKSAEVAEGYGAASRGDGARRATATAGFGDWSTLGDSLVITIGNARIVVGRNFDASLLRDVVAALRGGK